MMKQVRDRKSGLENLSGDFDLSLFASCKVVKHAPLEAVLAKSKVRVQGPVACKQERRESLRTYSTRDISWWCRIPFHRSGKKSRIWLSNEIDDL